jgi:hypothetical protein
MSNRPTDKDLENAAHQTEKHHDAAHRALAVEAVNRWNGFMRSVGGAGYSPQVGVAIAARFYFLDVYCPGCRQVKPVDLPRSIVTRRQSSRRSSLR